MIKVILGFVAVIFIALAGYMFTQSSKTAEHKIVKKVETKVTTSDEVEKPKGLKSKVKEHLSAKVEKKDVIHDLGTSVKSVKLSEDQIKKIESEVKGINTIHLDKEQLKKIESEVNGENSMILTDEQVKKIESEVNGSVKPMELNQAQLDRIESEVKGNNGGSVQLSDKQLKQIELEVKATL